MGTLVVKQELLTNLTMQCHHLGSQKDRTGCSAVGQPWKVLGRGYRMSATIHCHAFPLVGLLIFHCILLSCYMWCFWRTHVCPLWKAFGFIFRQLLNPTHLSTLCEPFCLNIWKQCIFVWCFCRLYPSPQCNVFAHVFPGYLKITFASLYAVLLMLKRKHQ